MLDRVWGWVTGRLFGSKLVTRLDALLALVLSALACGDASGVIHTGHSHQGIGAAIVVLAMTAPVAIRSSLPLVAVTILALGAIVKDIAIPPLVVCGATLPALILVTYSVGARLTRRPSMLGAAIAVVAMFFQSFSDPQLKGFGIGGSILLLALWGCGRLVRSRDAMVSRLRRQTDDLREQRHQTAELAVAADRARIAESLDSVLVARIGTLAQQAANGQAPADSQQASAALAAIENEGRQALSEMREIVGTLRVDAPIAPEPGIADIQTMLDRLPGTETRLEIEGERRRLPASIELSAYRIVERLLEPLDALPGASAEVTVRYEPDALVLTVLGRVRDDADPQRPVIAAREWVALHAGTLESRMRAGLAHTDVRLPLVPAING